MKRSVPEPRRIEGDRSESTPLLETTEYAPQTSRWRSLWKPLAPVFQIIESLGGLPLVDRGRGNEERHCDEHLPRMVSKAVQTEDKPETAAPTDNSVALLREEDHQVSAHQQLPECGSAPEQALDGEALSTNQDSSRIMKPMEKTDSFDSPLPDVKVSDTGLLGSADGRTTRTRSEDLRGQALRFEEKPTNSPVMEEEKYYTFSKPELCFVNLPGILQGALIKAIERNFANFKQETTVVISSIKVHLSTLDGGSTVTNPSDQTATTLLRRNHDKLNIGLNTPTPKIELTILEKDANPVRRHAVALGMDPTDRLSLSSYWIMIDGPDKLKLCQRVSKKSTSKQPMDWDDFEWRTILLIKLEHMPVAMSKTAPHCIKEFCVISSNGFGSNSGSDSGKNWLKISSDEFTRTIIGTIKFLRGSESSISCNPMEYLLDLPDYELRGLSQFMQRWYTLDPLPASRPARLHSAFPVVGELYLNPDSEYSIGFTMIECKFLSS